MLTHWLSNMIDIGGVSISGDATEICLNILRVTTMYSLRGVWSVFVP